MNIKKPELKSGDFHLVVSGKDRKMTAFDHTGKRLWQIPCLAEGVNGPSTGVYGGDTPEGLYKIGEVWRDINKVSSFDYDRALSSYGWMTFDMVELQGQELAVGRSGICLHGGGSGLGWPNAFAPMQKLLPTLGCLRIHNYHCLLIDSLLSSENTVYITVDQ